MTLKMHQRRWPGRKAHNYTITRPRESRHPRPCSRSPSSTGAPHTRTAAHRNPPHADLRDAPPRRYFQAFRTHDLSRAHHGPSIPTMDRVPPSADREQLSSVVSICPSMHSPARSSRRGVAARTPEEPEPVSGRPVVCPCAVAVPFSMFGSPRVQASATARERERADRPLVQFLGAGSRERAGAIDCACRCRVVRVRLWT